MPHPLPFENCNVAGHDDPAICQGCGAAFPFRPDPVVVSAFGYDLAPSHCEECDASRIINTPYDAPRSRVVDDLARDAKRADEWQSLTGPYFANFNASLLPRAIVPHVETVMVWMPDSARGIGFMGSTGTGKSRVIHELGRQLYMEGLDVFATSGIEFQRRVISQIQDRDGWRRYLARCEDSAILVLDDADKLKLTDAVEAEYYGMLEVRRRWLRPVLATLNVSGADIAASGSSNRGGPIATRLRDLCDFIPVA